MITLGIAFMTRGIALVITNGSSIGLYQYTKLQTIGNGGIGEWGYLIFISLGILALATVVVRTLRSSLLEVLESEYIERYTIQGDFPG
jgi:ribose/xylose/arabinose/galactoside ABC-type transport system permease subunit